MDSRTVLLEQGSEFMPKSSDPLTQYNLIIRSYNDPINRDNQRYLREVPSNRIYRLWFYLQSKAPSVLLISSLIPYLNTIVLCIHIFILLTSEFSMFIFSSNQRKVADPLKFMVYNPEICKKAGKHYLYFEIAEQEIELLNLHQETVKMLLERKHSYDFKVRFMVYDDSFLAAYCSISKSRYIILSHFLLCLMIVLIMHLFVFSDFLCLNIRIAKSLACDV